LVYEIRVKQIVVLVVTVGKRERKDAYKAAMGRKGEQRDNVNAAYARCIDIIRA
jgi:hypothetical protein